MSIQFVPSPITVAAERLRQAETQVETLRLMLSTLAGASPAREEASRRLAAGERCLYNRRLEFEALQRERRGRCALP